MKVIPDEWIGAALRAYHDARDDKMRLAIAAVALPIQRAERERCAKVADAFPARTHGALATASYAAAEQAAEEIAAAIRALD